MKRKLKKFKTLFEAGKMAFGDIRTAYQSWRGAYKKRFQVYRQIQKIDRLNINEYDGEMHQYLGRDINQIVTPNHRVLRKRNNLKKYELKYSSDIFNEKTNTTIPVACTDYIKEDYDISDMELKLLTIILCDGTINDKQKNCKPRVKIVKSHIRGFKELKEILDTLEIEYTQRTVTSDFKGANNFSENSYPLYNNETFTLNCVAAEPLVKRLDCTKKSLPSWFFELSKRQASLVINTWARYDGNTDNKNYGRQKLQCDNYEIANQLQHLCVIACMGSRILERQVGENTKETIYVIPYKRKHKDASTKKIIQYKGKIWCPTTQNGVVIFRKDRKIFISGNSAFSNVSIFDLPYLEALFGGKIFPDGSYMIDELENIREFQKDFLKVVSEIRTKNLMTFPVLTMALLRKDGKFVDEPFAKWCCEHNMKWADSNFFISEDVTSLSNCCFDGRQKVLIKNDDGVSLLSFKELYELNKDNTITNFTVFHNGSWIKSKILSLPKRDLYKVITTNNKEIYVTDNHINPTIDGDKFTTNLTDSDYLLFNTIPLDIYPKRDIELTYDQGYLIGMYLRDGSINDKRKDPTPTIHLSLNKEKYTATRNILNRALADLNITANTNLGKSHGNVYPIKINSIKLKNFIKEYISEQNSYGKKLDLKCLLQSQLFRRGILDGYGATDNRIYSTSYEFIEQVECLTTSLGFNSIIELVDRSDETIAQNKEFDEDCVLYYIQCYSNSNERAIEDMLKIRNNSIFFKIKSIEKIDSDDELVYCFETQNTDEPYFTLPNGIITHNCRLTSNIKDLGFINSIGGTALEVGSVKVNTINLARLAYENETKELYLKALKEKVVLCLQTLDVIRSIIQRNVEKGLLPNYSLGVMSMENQYSTIGVNGCFEAIKHFGLTYQDEFGNTHYTDEGLEFAQEIFKTITKVKDEFVVEKDYSVNIEQVPAERCAVILMQKDKLLFEDGEYDLPLYGNQFIPLGVKTTLQERIRLSAVLDKACNGGAILHANVDAPFNDFDTAWNLLNYIADQGVIYFAFNLRISACKNNHGYYGNTCPVCGEETETTYQRIIGYLVPTKTYSKERKEEFKLRDWLDLNSMSDL
jgi:hypothetical protein